MEERKMGKRKVFDKEWLFDVNTIVMMILAFFVWFMCLFVLWTPPAPKDINVLGWKQIKIQQDDTLWDITKAYKSVDIRLVIELIKEKNNIGSIIYPGKTLLVPIAVKYRWDK